jgi:hypothetical protein
MPRKLFKKRTLILKPVSPLEMKLMEILDNLQEPVTFHQLIPHLRGKPHAANLIEALDDLERRQLLVIYSKARKVGRIYETTKYYQSHPRRRHKEYYQAPISEGEVSDGSEGSD